MEILIIIQTLWLVYLLIYHKKNKRAPKRIDPKKMIGVDYLITTAITENQINQQDVIYSFDADGLKIKRIFKCIAMVNTDVPNSLLKDWSNQNVKYLDGEIDINIVDDQTLYRTDGWIGSGRLSKKTSRSGIISDIGTWSIIERELNLNRSVVISLYGMVPKESKPDDWMYAEWESYEIRTDERNIGPTYFKKNMIDYFENNIKSVMPDLLKNNFNDFK